MVIKIKQTQNDLHFTSEWVEMFSFCTNNWRLGDWKTDNDHGIVYTSYTVNKVGAIMESL